MEIWRNPNPQKLKTQKLKAQRLKTQKTRTPETKNGKPLEPLKLDGGSV